MDEQGLRDLIDDNSSDLPDETPTVATASDAVTFATALSAFETQADTVGFADLNNARFDAIPDSATADYAGFMRINAGPTANLAAQLDLTANFNTGVITGEQTSPFFATTTSGDDEYDGTIVVTSGKVGAQGVTNNARVSIAGTLTNDTNTVAVEGGIIGKFRGSSIEGISGSATVGDKLSLTLNGTSVVDGTAGFVVLND